jgi:hypothetical protein
LVNSTPAETVITHHDSKITAINAKLGVLKDGGNLDNG